MPQVRASPASLHCGPLARHIYPSLVLVQSRKNHPCLTERLLMGRKESNQTNKQISVLATLLHADTSSRASGPNFYMSFSTSKLCLCQQRRFW